MGSATSRNEVRGGEQRDGAASAAPTAVELQKFVLAASTSSPSGHSSGSQPPPPLLSLKSNSSRSLLSSDESSAATSTCSSQLLNSQVGRHGGQEYHGVVAGDDQHHQSFTALRLSYLLTIFVIMLADGLQGTHLYVLYESYGYSVASLYCLGFFTGGLLSPVTGGMVDQMGRKKAALLYCALEMFINQLEQYPYLSGLIASRMIGGFTTNLLHSVFETWLDTEYRKRGLAKSKYEILMRDSMIVSNLSAIISGYLSHVLATRYGNVGPFRGAVACTAIAFCVVAAVWTENYGDSASAARDSFIVGVDGDADDDVDEEDAEEEKGMVGFLYEAIEAFKNDKKMLKVGIIQGLSSGCLFTFVFLWAPMLIQLARNAPKNGSIWGLDGDGEPAFGLIFGAFMGAGVLGGVVAPPIRKMVSALLTPAAGDEQEGLDDEIEAEFEGEGKVSVRPMAVEFLAACCYFVGAVMLLFPCVFGSNETAFARVLAAFLVYEFVVGVFLPCEGVIRSLYFPENGRASIMAFPNILVNVAVSLGVLSTNFVSLTTAFYAISTLMVVCGVLQLSLISMREWSSLFAHVDNQSQRARRASYSAFESIRGSIDKSSVSMRRFSDFVGTTPAITLELDASDLKMKKDE